MAVLNDTLRPELARIKQELQTLERLRIRVGIQGDADSDILMIAGVHEYGATIRAKKAKNLTIPIEKEAQGKSPRDFPGLFFIEAESGYVFGCVLKGGRKNKDNMNNLKFLFLLLPSVTIPERSFIRASYDTGRASLQEIIEKAISCIYKEGWTARQAADNIGMQALQMTQEYFNTKLQPPKSSLTQKLSTQYQTLYDSGRLYHSITYVVEEA